MYADYLEEYPNSAFKENNLKERVRETLNELNTGTSNEQGTGRAALQSNEVLKKLKLTNGHASRNVLQHRSNIIHGKGETVSSVGSDDAKSVGTFSTVGSSRKTKAELLDQQAQSLRSMAQSMQTSTSMRQALLAQKVQESAQRIEQGKLAIRQQELDYLQSLRSANVITQEEFEQQVRAKLSL